IEAALAENDQLAGSQPTRAQFVAHRVHKCVRAAQGRTRFAIERSPPLVWVRPRRRISSRTRPPVATAPAPTATTGRTQLRRARSSLSESSSAQSESSSAAAAVTAASVSSTRPERRSGGSIGRSASESRRSNSLGKADPAASLIALSHLFLELLDRPVNEDL